MTLHCPFCAASIELGPECHETHGVYRFPTVCPICKKALDVAAIMAALGFPLLGADERWRSETCGGCAFRIDTGQCRRLPPTPVALGAGREDAREWYPLVKKDTPACAEWRERRGK